MNKAQLAKSLAEKLSISYTESLRNINTLLDIIGDELEHDQEVKIVGFGALVPWHQSARMGRNPKNGKNCMIEARTSVKFRVGKELLEKLNPVKS